MKYRTKVMFMVGVVASILTSVSAQAVTDKQRAEIEARIKPAGQVCLDSDSDCGAAVVAVAVERSGEDVYNAACMACHMTGAGGAPIVGNVDAWVARIAKGSEVLYQSGIEGIPGTGMMARGACMDCSDEDIIAAVDHMIANSK